MTTQQEKDVNDEDGKKAALEPPTAFVPVFEDYESLEPVEIKVDGKPVIGADGNPEKEYHVSDLYQFTTLKQVDRQGLVQLTSREAVDYGGSFLNLSTLELSALGANTDISGTWNVPEATLGAWHDISLGGRTVRSVITDRGYLFPLGHKAVITTYFDRVIASDPVQNNRSSQSNFAVAYLQMHTVITVGEQIKTYGAGTVGQPFPLENPVGGTTDWPFTQVRMITLSSPDLDYPLAPFVSGTANAQAPVIPTYTNDHGESNNVQWTFVATDLAGRDVTFKMPLLFVYVGSEFDTGTDANPGFCERMVKAYHLKSSTDLNETALRASYIGGAPVQFAPDTLALPDGTTHPTFSILLGSATSSYNPYATDQPTTPGKAALEAAGQPNFYPTLARARIRLHAAEVLIGQDLADTKSATDPLPWGATPKETAAGTPAGVEIHYYPDWVSGGVSSTFGVPTTSPPSGAPPSGPSPNNGAVYATIVEGLPVNFPANTVGGIGTPNATLSGLSATAGLVGGDLDSFANSAPFSDLSAYFGEASKVLTASLLGGLTLGEILGTAFTMPTITSQTSRNGVRTVTYTMSTAIGPEPSSDPIFVPDNPGAMMTLKAVSTPASGKTPATSMVSGSIDPFSIYLLMEEGSLGVLMLHFQSVTFTSGSGQSTAVKVNLDNVQFIGCLEFVQTLEQFLQSLGIGGLAITVEPTDVKLGLSFALPDQYTGVFDLSGISFTVGIVIPFINGPAVASFAFASQNDPFTVTYLCVGGGGFCSLAIGFGGIQSLQAQFEVEVEAAIGIEVASGSVSLSIGIYFTYTAEAGASLAGVVQLSGQVELIGIVTVSIIMHLSLTWEITAGAVQGTATLRVGISVCGFGVSIPVTVSKSFGGATAPPSGVGSPSTTTPDSGDDEDAFIVGAPSNVQLDAVDLKAPTGLPGVVAIGANTANPNLYGLQPNSPFAQPTPPLRDTTAESQFVFGDLITVEHWQTYCGAFSA